MPGPLKGLRVIEIAGVGPCPFAGMMLADHGAEVIRIDRIGGVKAGPPMDPAKDILSRSRKSICVDLKHEEGTKIVRALCKRADCLIEGFRPNVMERLRLGPAVLLDDNPRLVYGRMTGWGQTGPLAQAAGHDINYISITGNLHTYGRAGCKPTPPLNAVGDFGGGGMLLAFAVVSAMLHARGTGQGQVIDCSVMDGAALLASMTWSLRAMCAWSNERGSNLLDSGAPFYETYETADNRYVALGPIEPHFYARFRALAGISDDPEFGGELDVRRWPALKEKLATLFKSKSRDQWCALLEGTDACFAPILSMDEARHHPHCAARGTFIEVDGVVQPSPAPRYSATSCSDTYMCRMPGADGRDVLSSIGYDDNTIDQLRARGIMG
jgi:alpha-methylacyl-CoA racemase